MKDGVINSGSNPDHNACDLENIIKAAEYFENM